MMQVEVGLWSPQALLDYGDCPDNVFSFQGEPLENGDFPQPALVGSTYLDVGREQLASVTLACSDPDQLDAAECKPEVTSVIAVVDAMSTSLPVPTWQAENLDVSVGEPRAITDDEGVVIKSVLEPSDTYDLDVVGVIPPYWTGEDLPGFASHGCVLVLDRLPPRAVTSVACQRKEDFEQGEAGEDTLHGLLLSDNTMENILIAAGMEDIFPDEGLVVGRVVSDVGAPVESVRVSTDDPDATVEYIADDWAHTTGDATAGNAYFISRNATWPSHWTAEHTICGHHEDGTYVAGLIEGKVTVLLLRLEPAPEGCTAKR
jgi:hypothetical protein